MFTLTASFESANELVDFIRPHTVSEVQETSSAPVVQVTPVTPVAPVVTYTRDTLGKVMVMLSDPRFTLRKVSTILEEAGVRSEKLLFEMLSDCGIEIVIKHMNQGHEKLIGLRSRN